MFKWIILGALSFSAFVLLGYWQGGYNTAFSVATIGITWRVFITAMVFLFSWVKIKK